MKTMSYTITPCPKCGGDTIVAEWNDSVRLFDPDPITVDRLPDASHRMGLFSLIEHPGGDIGWRYEQAISFNSEESHRPHVCPAKEGAKA